MNQTNPIAATVIETGNGWCQVRTDGGAILRVVATDSWPNKARVLILSGAIIGKASPLKNIPTFQV